VTLNRKRETLMEQMAWVSLNPLPCTPFLLVAPAATGCVCVCVCVCVCLCVLTCAFGHLLTSLKNEQPLWLPRGGTFGHPLTD